MNSRITGISHITFICKDLDKTSYFLKQVFDAKEIYSSGDKQFSIAKEKFFKIGDIWLAIMQGDSVKPTYNHIAFKVEGDLSKFKKRIEDCDLTILKGRGRKQAEGESLYFYDYDNHLFELHTGDLETRLAYYKGDKNEL